MAKTKLLLPAVFLSILLLLPYLCQAAPDLNLSSTHYNSYGQAVSACAVCSKTTINASKPYGSVPATALGYVPAGNVVYYPYKVNNTVYVYNVSVAKASPSITISVDGQNVTGEGTYYTTVNGIPIQNPPDTIGTPAQYYWLNVTLSNRVINGNPLNNTYSIVLSNGTKLVPTSTESATDFRKTYSYKIAIGVNAIVTHEAIGNGNYLSEDPTDIIGGEGTQGTGNGYIQGGPITASGQGLLSTLNIKMAVGGNGNAEMGLYNSAGTQLLCDVIGATTSGWSYIDASSCAISIQTGGNYIIVTNLQSGSDRVYLSHPETNYYISPYAYGTMPSTFSYSIGTYLANLGMSYSGDTTSTTTTSTSTTTSTTTSVVTTIPYISALTGSTPTTTGYETQGQGFQYSITFNNLVSNAMVYLSYNNIVVNSTDAGTITHNPQTFTFNHRLPLLPANNVFGTFNCYAVVNVIGGSMANTGTFNSLKQTELWNYVPSVSAYWSNIIFGQNETINVIVTDSQGLGLASYSGVMQSGSRNSISEYQSSANHYYSNLTSFIPSYYGYTNPSVVNSITIGGNAIIQFTYGTSSLFRNQSFSFVSTNESIGKCGVSPFTSNALGWSFYTLPNQALYTSNVNLQGYYQVVKNTWSGPVIQGTSAGLSNPGNTFATCMFPSWSNSPYNGFGVSGSFSYTAGNYPAGGFYLAGQPITSTQTQIKLYLANQTDFILYSIAVENTSTSAYIPSIVQILQYLPDTNSSVLVNEVQTPSAGTAQAYLNFGTKYRFGVYSLAGKLLTLTPFYTIQTCASQPCLLVIYLSNPNVTTLGTQLGNIQHSCTRTDNNVTNVQYNTTISCTYSSASGASFNTSLEITSGFMNTPVCSRNVNSQSGSLSCTVSNTNNTQYNWIFSVKVSGQDIQLSGGTFGLQGYRFGLLGVFIALIIVIACGLLFVSKNPIIAVVLADVGFVGSSVIGLLAVPVPILGALQLVVCITIFVMMKQ